MANSPVDRNEKIMEKENGTKCLITDPKADFYLARHKEQESQWQDSKPG